MFESFDAIIIGAGQAGPSLAVRLAGVGRKVALIERERLGGTCVNTGCIPTKTLVASARVAHVVRTSAQYGIMSNTPVVDMKMVKARKDAVVQHSRDNLSKWIVGTKNLELIIGEAHFTGPKQVEVGDRKLHAPMIILNTGGRPVVPDWPGLSKVPYLTNVEMMDMDRIPDHLIVAGGSYIGLEFAQVYRRFGAKVTVVEYADRIIAREDEAVSQAVHDILTAEGIEIHTSARDFSVSAQEQGLRLTISKAGQMIQIDGSDLLMATGRRPNVEALNLAAAGIALDPRGYIAVDDQLQTQIPGIYALGDVHGRGAFTHTSYNDYEILAANLLGQETRSLKDRLVPYALFTDPPLARVGLNEAAARALGRPILMAKMPMSRIGRARERDEMQGFISVIADAETDAILGATLLGIEADEVIHLFIQAMTQNLTYKQMSQCVPVHPTVSEIIPTLLAQLAPV